MAGSAFPEPARHFEAAADPGQTALRLEIQHALRGTRLTRAELEALVPLAASASQEVRLWTLRILEGRWGTDEACDGVLLGICRAAARDEDPKTREYVARTLTGAPEAFALPLLAALAADGAWNVRAAAARVLASWPGGGALLESLESDGDERVRRAAARARERSSPPPR